MLLVSVKRLSYWILRRKNVLYFHLNFSAFFRILLFGVRKFGRLGHFDFFHLQFRLQHANLLELQIMDEIE